MYRRFSFRMAWAVIAALALGTACAGKRVDTEDVKEGSDFGRSDPGMGSERTIPGTNIPEPTGDLSVVYFDFDMSNIRRDQRTTLEKNAATLGANQWKSLTIEGHCDERGSEEYNLALGERRANAVRRYLTDLGVPRSKLNVVSFGEERSAVRGHDETAWRYNRRAEFALR